LNFRGRANELDDDRERSIPSLRYFISFIYRDLACRGLAACARGLVLLALLSACLFALPSPGQEAPRRDGASGAEQAEGSELFQGVIANQKRQEALLDVYERMEKTEFRKAGSDTKPNEIKVLRIFPAGTGADKIAFAPDGKPLDAQSYRADLEKLEKQLLWAAQQGSAQRDAYAKQERHRKEKNDLMDSTRQAFIFTRIGEEQRGDEMLAKFSMKPNPNYKATTRNAMLFTKVEGTLWIDEKKSELARIEGHVTEDISLALFLARIYKGSYFMQERYELEPGIWLPTYQQYDFDGRKFVVPFSIHERTFYTNYRRVGPPAEAAGAIGAELDKLKAERGEP